MTRREPSLRRFLHVRLGPASRNSLRISGWGLIELLITLACVGIVLSWATSQYSSYRQRSQRAQARTQLLKTALWMERSASANGHYPSPSEFSNGTNNSSGSDAPNGSDSADSPSSPVHHNTRAELLYQFQLESTATTYTLLATPIGPQNSDPCGTFTLNHLGERSVQHAHASASTNLCWER